MRKALLLCLVVVALLVMASAAFAAESAGISVTVTLQSLGVSLDQSAWPIGTVVAGATAGPFAVVATNTGNVNEKFTIATSDSAGWTAGAASGVNVFVISAGSTVLTTSAQTLAASVAPAGTSNFNLNFTAPAAGSVVAAQSFTVTVACTTP